MTKKTGKIPKRTTRAKTTKKAQPLTARSGDSGDLPEALRGRRRLEPDGRFVFSCDSGLPCFTSCCADVNIFLTPLDVLSLARRIGISTSEFIERHALTPITKDLGLPVLILRMGDAPERRCPFVGEKGCTVYEDRPWSCRMYPVGMGLPPARAGKEPQPAYFLFEDDFCKGRTAPKAREWTVEEWRRDQGVIEREAAEDGYRQIVTHPWFIGGRHLDPKRMEVFHTACYDLDKFRSFIFESTFLKRFELEDSLVEELRADDDALMRFAFRWLRFALFGEPTMKVREGASDSRRKA